MVTLKAEVVADLGRATSQDGPKLGLSRDQVQLMEIAVEARAIPELMTPPGRTNRTKFRPRCSKPGSSR